MNLSCFASLINFALSIFPVACFLLIDRLQGLFRDRKVFPETSKTEV